VVTEPAGTEVPIIWRGRRARAFVPALLSDRDLSLDPPTAAKAAAAAVEVGHAAEALDGDLEALARLMLHSEGVASSYIEGVTAPTADIVVALEQRRSSQVDAAAWVASNLAALSQAVVDADRTASLSIEMLCEWQRTLMTGSPTPERHVGVVRDEQGWIGGTNPLDAHLVTPPPEHLPALLDDVVAYAGRRDVDPIAQAAIVHAQFEIIHPFADGNGRVGRVLVAWILARYLALVAPPPFSVAVAADIGGYASGLTLFRMGDHGRWIQWFADGVAGGSRAQRALVTEVGRVTQGWHRRLMSSGRRPRSDAAVFHALDLLPGHPVVTSGTLIQELGVTRKAALATLDRLVQLGILIEHGTIRSGGAGRPFSCYVSPELLGLISSPPLR
jgi:Fic family protein